MAKIIFYEKPGCANNTRQKRILISLGHEIEERNILTSGWTKESLEKFLDGFRPGKWVNPNAPLVKQGKLDPWILRKEEAIEKMIHDPILIRRPLMIIHDKFYIQGFDLEKINLLIKSDPAKVAYEASEKLIFNFG